MQIPVLIEPIQGGCFRARVGEPFRLSAEGTTADDATRRVCALVDGLLRGGARVTTITIGAGECVNSVVPPLPTDELYKNDWAYRELVEAIAENRRQDEAANP